MRKAEEDQGAKLVRAMLSVLLGGVMALVVSLLFLLVAAICLARGWLGEGLAYQLVIVACVLGSFAGGRMAVRRCTARRLIVGLLVGAVLFLLLLTVGVLFYDTLSPETGGLGLLCGCLCGGAVSGLLGAGRKKKRRK